MKYLFTQLFLLFISVIFLYYFSTVPNFVPFDIEGELDWPKIAFVMFNLFLVLESFISLVVYLVEKFIAYGKKEFPSSRLSLKWGLGISLTLIGLLFLHINHLISLGLALVIFVSFVIIIIII